MNKNIENTLDLASFFPYQFSILAEQMSEYIAQIYRKQYGLSRFEWRVLATVAQHQDISAKDIALFTQLDKMQISRAVSKLKSTMLLNQQTSKQDRRTSKVSLTSKGLKLYQEIVPLVRQQEQQLLSGLTEQERELFKAITQKLSRQLSEV